MADDAGGFPRTVAEAADRVLSDLSEEDKEQIQNTPRDALIQLHFGLGIFVRNACGLWAGNEELAEACAQAGHPDEASAVVVEEVWRRLQA